MKVKVIRNVVQYGAVYGKKGETIDLPDTLAKELIEAKAVAAIKESANSK